MLHLEHIYVSFVYFDLYIRYAISLLFLYMWKSKKCVFHTLFLLLVHHIPFAQFDCPQIKLIVHQTVVLAAFDFLQLIISPNPIFAS